MMTSDTRSVLVTGGSNGIGRALAERFLAEGARVLVTGRDAGRLAAVAAARPGLDGFVSDMGVAADREALARHVVETMPEVDIVINNAGIQRRVGLAEDDAEWPDRQREIDILLSGPIHLNSLLVPVMLAHGRRAVIVNVTSGGAYIPQTFAPVYAACKAALHSYTVTLRHALRETPVRVVELIPPAVATGLAGSGQTHGAPLDAFCDAVFAQLTGDAEEIGYGPTATEAFKEAQAPYHAMFETSARRFPVRPYRAEDTMLRPGEAGWQDRT